MSIQPQTPEVHYDHAQGVLFVGPLRTSDKDVLREAARWSTGERGETVPLAELDGVDLAPFAREALKVGARVLTVMASDGDTRAVQQAVKSASEQVDQAVQKAVTSADQAVQRATETLNLAARQAHETVMERITRLIGGENPELLARLDPVLTQVGADLQRQVTQSFEQASTALRHDNDKRHTELTALIREVQQSVTTKVTEIETATAVKAGTTLKGFDFEDALHIIFAQIAAGLGDEYQETGEFAGVLPRNKKGDGVLHLADGQARVVIEAHDGATKEWGTYLAEAERNREAVASIGVVKHLVDNAGQVIRVIGPKRLVIAFDPAVDDVELLRTVVLLMKTVALASTSRRGTEEVDTANEKIKEALASLGELDAAKKSVHAISGHTATIEKAIAKTTAAVQRELDAALIALGGAAPERALQVAPAPDGCLDADSADSADSGHDRGYPAAEVG